MRKFALFLAALLWMTILSGCRTTTDGQGSDVKDSKPSVDQASYHCISPTTGKTYDLRPDRGEMDVKSANGQIKHFTELDVQDFPSETDAHVTLTQFVVSEGDVVATLAKKDDGSTNLTFELDDDAAKCQKGPIAAAAAASSMAQNELFVCVDGSRKFTVRREGQKLTGIFYDFGGIPQSFSCKEVTKTSYVCQKASQPKKKVKAGTDSGGRRSVEFFIERDDGHLFDLTCAS